MINKKTLLIGSGFMLGTLYLLQYLVAIEVISCGNDPRLACYFFLQHLSGFALGLVPVFVFSGVTYFMRESVFSTWLKSVYVYLPVLALVVVATSSNNGGYIFSSDLFIMLMMIIPVFAIVSLTLIIWKWSAPRHEDSGKIRSRGT